MRLNLRCNARGFCRAPAWFSSWQPAKPREPDSILLSVTTSKLFVTVCKGGEDVPQLGMNAPRLTQLDKDGTPG